MELEDVAVFMVAPWRILLLIQHFFRFRRFDGRVGVRVKVGSRNRSRSRSLDSTLKAEVNKLRLVAIAPDDRQREVDRGGNGSNIESEAKTQRGAREIVTHGTSSQDSGINKKRP